MRLLALDLATRTGFAYGDARSSPSSGSVLLKHPSETGVAKVCGNLSAWLQKIIREKEIELVVIEAPMSARGVQMKGGSEASMFVAIRLDGAALAVIDRMGVRYEHVAVSTVRKHFIGRANMGNRDKTKSAVIGRCRLLGYMQLHDNDDNRADALALWDYAARTIARQPPKTLHLFGGTP